MNLVASDEETTKASQYIHAGKQQRRRRQRFGCDSCGSNERKLHHTSLQVSISSDGALLRQLRRCAVSS